MRVIAATSRDLAALVRQGLFREDLFYRLHVLPLRVPPLRERPTDIPALVELLADEICLRNGYLNPEFLPDALALLMGQRWRGNARELRNVVEQVLLRAETDRVNADLVASVLREAGVSELAPPHSVQTVAAPSPASGPDLRPLAEQVAELEARALAAALAASGGNKLAAARRLGISRAKLYDRLAARDLAPPAVAPSAGPVDHD